MGGIGGPRAGFGVEAEGAAVLRIHEPVDRRHVVVGAGHLHAEARS